MVNLKGRAATPKDRTVNDDAVRLAILEHLLTGKSIKTVALDVEYHHTQVLMVASAHGYPNERRMQWSRDLLAERIAHPEGQAAAKVAEPAAKARPAKPRTPKAPAALRPTAVRRAPAEPAPEMPVQSLGAPVHGDVLAPTPTNPRPSSPGSLTDLIARGRASSRESTRHVAEAFVFALRGLRAALAEDQGLVQAVQAVHEQQPVVKPEPAAAPEKKKRKSPTGPSAWERQGARLTPLGVSVQDVKAWGAEHGYPLTRGPILVTGLLDAYEEAHR